MNARKTRRVRRSSSFSEVDDKREKMETFPQQSDGTLTPTKLVKAICLVIFGAGEECVTGTNEAEMDSQVT